MSFVRDKVLLEPWKGPDLLTQLPPEITQRILTYLKYDQVAQIRPTCRLLNEMCAHVLNTGFRTLEQHHARSWQIVKSRLPRRESERRTHILARHNDILSAFETRLSLLSMTYVKFIEIGLCCFIPGRVLDEAFGVLRAVDRSLKTNTQPPRPLDVLQELRDVSSMAMEYFDERVAPGLKDVAVTQAQAQGGYHSKCSSKELSSLLLVGSTASTSNKLMQNLHDASTSSLPSLSTSPLPGFAHPLYCTPAGSTHVSRTLTAPPNGGGCRSASACQSDSISRSLVRLKKRVTSQATTLTVQQSELNALKSTNVKLETQVREQRSRLVSQSRAIGTQARKIEDLAKTVKELNKRVLEYGAQLTDAVTDQRTGIAASSSADTDMPAPNNAINMPDTDVHNAEMPAVKVAAIRKRKRKADGAEHSPPTKSACSSGGYNLRRR